MEKNHAKQKNTHSKAQKILPVNTKAKDTFFKKVYEKEERQRSLASFLLGLPIEKVSTANIRPVLFGNKENDFACLCDDVFYILTEEQSLVSPNIPYRLLEYATAGLRTMVESEPRLYGRKRVFFPIPKLYVLQVGLESAKGHLPQNIQYDISLSDSYLSADGKYDEDCIPMPDLDATVHIYDFRMTLDEILIYIERASLPQRFAGYENDMRNYALTANGITYMLRTSSDARYTPPRNISTVTDFLMLLLERHIFVDLLSDKEVCDMTMAQFSRDDILFCQGREEGRLEGREEGRLEGKIEGRLEGQEEGRKKGRKEGQEEGIKAFILDKIEDGVAENIIVKKLQKHFTLDEQAAQKYCRIYLK